MRCAMLDATWQCYPGKSLQLKTDMLGVADSNTLAVETGSDVHLAHASCKVPGLLFSGCHHVNKQRVTLFCAGDLRAFYSPVDYTIAQRRVEC